MYYLFDFIYISKSTHLHFSLFEDSVIFISIFFFFFYLILNVICDLFDSFQFLINIIYYSYIFDIGSNNFNICLKILQRSVMGLNIPQVCSNINRQDSIHFHEKWQNDFRIQAKTPKIITNLDQKFCLLMNDTAVTSIINKL